MPQLTTACLLVQSCLLSWGIATVVMFLAYGDGFGQAFANIFANFGTKLVIVVPGKTSTQAGGQKSGVQIRFTQDDVEALSTNLPQITYITPSVDKQANVQYDTRVFTFTVSGNDPTVYSIRTLKLGQGRFYNMQDQLQRARRGGASGRRTASPLREPRLLNPPKVPPAIRECLQDRVCQCESSFTLALWALRISFSSRTLSQPNRKHLVSCYWQRFTNAVLRFSVGTLERRILIVILVFITGTPQPKPSCPGMDAEKDLEKLDPSAAEKQYQSLLSQIAQARVSAQFEGDTRAETTAATLSSRATIEAFKVGPRSCLRRTVIYETPIDVALEFPLARISEMSESPQSPL